jgi:lipopolysaccharide biosynthesis regulator YciM
MAKAELAGFPTNQWADPSILPQLEQADAALRTALLSDPANRTANHRLGLIALLRRDFPSAAAFLEEAYRSAPNHRGVIKALGYCYAWLGEMEKARSFLSKIPEARTELDVYTWWWRTQGQPGLADRASTILSELNR